MKCQLIISFLLLIQGVYANSIEIVRDNYANAINDKNICAEMIEYLQNNKSETLNLAYLGAYQAVMANHVINPISKLKYFNQGKENLEKAIAKANTNAEMRYLRLSIQKNIPKFLKYSAHIQEDTEYISKHRNMIKSNVVIRNIDNLLAR